MEARAGGNIRGTLDYLVEVFKRSSEYIDLSKKSKEGYDYCAAKASGYLLRDGRPLGQQRIEHLSVPVLQRVVETMATGRPAIGKLPLIAATPAAANRVASYLRRLFAWGIRHGHCTSNPADGIRKVREKRDARMPDHDSFDAVLRFARTCASRQAHTAGSCPPYLPAVMVLAYAVRLRGIEVNTLTDANLQTDGIRSNRRKGSRDNVTLWTKDLRAAVKWLQSYRDERMQAHGRPVPIKPEQRRLLVSESGTPLTKSALDSAWQRLVRRAIAEDVIDRGGAAVRAPWPETPGNHRQRGQERWRPRDRGHASAVRPFRTGGESGRETKKEGLILPAILPAEAKRPAHRAGLFR